VRPTPSANPVVASLSAVRPMVSIRILSSELLS
jgi:hypothetical protein